MNHSVIVKNVSKKYKLYNKTSEKLLDIIIPDGYGEDFFALQNINFTADHGDVIGVIGVNGAGKSTLSNIITGIVPPTSGEIKIKGQASLIAIASGLNNQLTGRDNIELKCLMLGFNKKKILELMPSIIEFAEIGNFIDQPVKSYSSGMKSRLGFAISVNIDPDILVIDEALSVGDRNFADKCLDKMNEFKEEGKTIFFISHSIGQVKKFCQKALWLEAGEIKAYGTVQKVIPQYEKFLKEYKAMSKEDQNNFKQLVLEKRSKLNEVRKKSFVVPENEVLLSQRRQKKYNRQRTILKRTLVVLLVLNAIAIGIVYAQYQGYFTRNTPPPEPVLNADPVEQKNTDLILEVEEKDEEEIRPDIRYVTVPSAFIRTEPDLDSEPLSMANFGRAFLIHEIYNDPSSEIEWLRITDSQLDEEGWISSNIALSIEEELEDDTLIAGIDELLNMNPVLNEVIPMVGSNEGKEINFEHVEYVYELGKVNGFIILGISSSELELINELGEPQLRQDDIFLYHGLLYDYTFFTSDDGYIYKLTIMGR